MSVTLRERQVRLRGGAGRPGRRPENLRRIGYGIQRAGRSVMSGGVGQLVMNGPLILAVPVAAAAGAITFISPCCLPLIPGYLSYVTGMSGADAEDTGAVVASSRHAGEEPAAGSTPGPVTTPARGRALAGTALFVLGFSAVFASYGAAFGGLGEVLLAHQRGLIQVLGGLTIVLG